MTATDPATTDPATTDPATTDPATTGLDVTVPPPPLPLRRAVTLAARVVLPFLLIMIAWAMSNPPGAAPDEPDHLVKAIAMARLHIGKPVSTKALPAAASALAKRNASISRIVPVPADLVPRGYNCTAHNPDKTAKCLPTTLPKGSGTVEVSTTMGSYPAFFYLPIGIVARTMDTPVRAFLAARLACVVMGAILLLLGVATLVRWLGRRALLGAFVGLTPMALFASSMVSTSGIEICGAFAVASVTVVAIRRPEALDHRSTLVVLAVTGASLILSRQLGIVTFGALILLLLARIGRAHLVRLFRRHDVTFLATVAVLVLAALAIFVWERRYDHPSNTGPVFANGVWEGFDLRTFSWVRGGVGNFGWLDSPVPRWTVFAWVVLLVTLLGMAIMLGRALDRWTIIGWLVLLAAVAYVTYATVFFPIMANLQARHLLPFFMFAPLLAGVVLADTVAPRWPDAVQRLFRLTAVVMPVIQFVAVYANAQRYAVGYDGRTLFLGHSRWAPKFGWVPWLLLALIGAGLLAFTILRCDRDEREVSARVAR